jgi:hypothetical protein
MEFLTSLALEWAVLQGISREELVRKTEMWR